jgi:hypothetical protein
MASLDALAPGNVTVKTVMVDEKSVSTSGGSNRWVGGGVHTGRWGMWILGYLLIFLLVWATLVSFPPNWVKLVDTAGNTVVNSAWLFFGSAGIAILVVLIIAIIAWCCGGY